MTSTADRHLIEGSNFDEIYYQLLSQLNQRPQYVCSPRGSKIKENIAVTLLLHNPRARLLNCKKRNTNYGFGVGEFLWYWQGKQDLKTMVYYNKRMKDYSDDGKTLTSAYGHRLKTMQFTPNGSDVGSTMSQWQAAIQTLVADPDSRRALMLINQPGDEVRAAMLGSKDVPCTLSLQFFIRDNRLELHTHMRSNDVMWGLTYDLFSFTLFQECMLLELQKEKKFNDLKLGYYYHTAGSLHLYEQHFDQSDQICYEYAKGVELSPPMEPLSDLESLEEVCSIEEALRTNLSYLILTGDLEGTPLWMVQQLESHKDKRDAERVQKKNG